jgi:L-alanine-DL-glutamate epimerase-like enolase superfamily enzyme
MKITKLEMHVLRAPDESRPHWVSHFKVPKANEILVRVQTDQGVEGIGIATSYTPIEAAIHAVRTGIAELIIGADPLAPEQLYEKLFTLTSQRLAHEKGWSREAIIRISAAVDIAVWDIIGKVAGLPLYRLFGGYRSEVPCYVTCAYYRDGKDMAELRDEMQMLKAQGHKGFKGKVGGVPLKEDIERMALVREVVGNDKDLMIDVNRAWDLRTAIEGARLLEPLHPRWLEEPVRWADDRRELKLLAQQTRIPLSAGESELTSYGCRALLEEQAIQILQFDCTMMGGFTEGRKLAALCELNHVQVAPHHDCFIHAHIVAASPAGCIVESFTDPERDPLQAELFENPPKIANGMLTLKEQPGLGLTLSAAALKKFGERIL